jgi:hypothetical protein
MIFIAASCPSNNEAAVTSLIFRGAVLILIKKIFAAAHIFGKSKAIFRHSRFIKITQ